jgi:hypothetical protein
VRLFGPLHLMSPRSNSVGLSLWNIKSKVAEAYTFLGMPVRWQ